MEEIESSTQHLFCSAKLRPDCTHNNLCCLHCPDTKVCKLGNTKKVKPCTTKNCGLNEKCEFQI